MKNCFECDAAPRAWTPAFAGVAMSSEFSDSSDSSESSEFSDSSDPCYFSHPGEGRGPRPTDLCQTEPPRV